MRDYPPSYRTISYPVLIGNYSTCEIKRSRLHCERGSLQRKKGFLRQNRENRKEISLRIDPIFSLLLRNKRKWVHNVRARKTDKKKDSTYMFLAVLKMTQTGTFEFFDRVYPHYAAHPGRKNGSEYIFLFVKLSFIMRIRHQLNVVFPTDGGIW